MSAPHEPQFLFEEPVGRWTLIGAILGGLLVVAMFVAGVLLTDTDPAFIGAAGLAAPFGGAGFGAMMGAVLGGIRAAEIEAEGRRPPAASDHRSTPDPELVHPPTAAD